MPREHELKVAVYYGNEEVRVTSAFVGLGPYHPVGGTVGPRSKVRFLVAFKPAGVGYHELTVLLKWNDHVADHKSVTVKIVS